MKAFHELDPRELTSESLRHEIDARGYVLLRDLIPVEAVDTVLSDVTITLARAGWLLEGSDSEERLPVPGVSYGDPDPIFKDIYQQVFNLESLHSLSHNPSLQKMMRLLVGHEVLVHPKPIGRLIFPNCERLVVRAHQDYEFMQGDPEFYTVWIPLHDCSVREGSLRILEGSHHRGLIDHQREGLHVPELSLDGFDESNWVSGQVCAGDVLIFHSFTVHAANPNVADRMRLSIDCRFQSAHRDLHPSNLVFAGESGKSWEKTYSGWRSKELQYYWKKLSLSLKPSRIELEKLAASAQTAKQRERYARMVAQLT